MKLNQKIKTTSSGTPRKKQISSNNKLIKLFATTGLLAGFVGTSVSAATLLGTATYTGYSGQATSAADSPFFSTFGAIFQQDPNLVPETTSIYDFRGLTATVANGSGDTYFFLEDVQDGQMDTPGATYSSGAARVNGTSLNGSDSSQYTDNVLEDTMTIGSFKTVNTTTGAMRVDFIAADLGGQLPTYVGAVYVDGDTSSSGKITAYDSDDNILETLSQSSAMADPFLGLSTDSGISYVILAGNNEIDHFQYGFVAVPEPSTTALLGLGGLALILRRRK
ncbi:MAG: PEP-CTERM sorting domain-containing protein [Akkermansiaceae bacterium]